jgi:MFS family permease
VASPRPGPTRAGRSAVFAQALMMFVLGPLGGAGADRWSKRRILALAQSSSTLVLATFAILLARGALTITLLAAGTLILGAGLSFLGPARQSLAAELVPVPLRGNAVALNQVALTGSQVAGPLCAGLLLDSTAGAAGAYGLMAVLYAIAVGLLALLPVPIMLAGGSGGSTRVLTDLLDGLRYTRGNPQLRLQLLLFAAVVMIGFPYITLLPGLVGAEFGMDPAQISSLYLYNAVGGLGSSLVVARFADSRRAPWLFVALGAVLAAALAALSRAPSFAAAQLVMFGVGVGAGGFQTLNGALLARNCEPAYFGRVFSLAMLAFAAFGLAGLPIGVLADMLGERLVLSGMAGAVALLVVILGRALVRA